MIHVVHGLPRGEQIYAELFVHDKPIKIQVDSGATVNILPEKLSGDVELRPTTIVLQMWNKSVVRPLGEAKVPIYNQATENRYFCHFVIVPNNQGFIHLLGNRVSQKMGLITVNENNFKRIASVMSSLDPI